MLGERLDLFSTLLILPLLLEFSILLPGWQGGNDAGALEVEGKMSTSDVYAKQALLRESCCQYYSTIGVPNRGKKLYSVVDASCLPRKMYLGSATS
jgi:hypothetical protein